jgi:hypothetical protein
MRRRVQASKPLSPLTAFPLPRITSRKAEVGSALATQLFSNHARNSSGGWIDARGEALAAADGHPPALRRPTGSSQGQPTNVCVARLLPTWHMLAPCPPAPVRPSSAAPLLQQHRISSWGSVVLEVATEAPTQPASASLPKSIASPPCWPRYGSTPLWIGGSTLLSTKLTVKRIHPA